MAREADLNDDISPAQVRAARALLDMSQVALAEAAGLTRLVIVRYEAEETAPREASLRRIRAALAARGVTFFRDRDGLGVRLQVPQGS